MHPLKTNSYKKRRNAKLLAAAILVAFIAFVLALLYLRGQEQDSTGGTAPSMTSEHPDVGNEIKEEFLNKETEASVQAESQGDHSSNGSEGETPSGDMKSHVQITSAAISNDTLRVRVAIQTIDSDGNCTLTLSKPNQASIIKKVKTQTMGSYTTCQGFDVDTSNLSAGNWTIDIKYQGSKDRQGTASTIAEVL